MLFFSYLKNVVVILVINLKNFIQDKYKNENNFSKVQYKILEFNTLRKGFRRKGLFTDKSASLNETFYEASKFLNKGSNINPK